MEHNQPHSPEPKHAPGKSEHFLKDKKPPVVTGHDARWAHENGGRSVPNRAEAPDGVSGCWN